MTPPQKMTVRPIAIAPMTVDGDIQQDNIVAISMRNAGTATVDLWNGAWTLAPKETVSLNVLENGAIIDTGAIPVSFDTSTGTVKKLQIIIVPIKAC